MTDREEREKVIEVLKSWDGYFIGYTSDEVQEALRYAIASIETDIRYDLLYEETSEQADKPTTKNDLGVDVISRADAIKAMQDKAKKLTNEDTINGLCGAVAILFDLLSVTPQEPRKGHWEHGKELSKEYRGRILVDVTYADWHCSNCHCVIEESIKPKWNYCPGCGAKMQVVEE